MSEKITVADGIKVRRAAPKSAKESRAGFFLINIKKELYYEINKQTKKISRY